MAGWNFAIVRVIGQPLRVEVSVVLPGARLDERYDDDVCLGDRSHATPDMCSILYPIISIHNNYVLSNCTYCILYIPCMPTFHDFLFFCCYSFLFFVFMYHGI